MKFPSESMLAIALAAGLSFSLANATVITLTPSQIVSEGYGFTNGREYCCSGASGNEVSFNQTISRRFFK